MKCSIDISNFLQEISIFPHSIVFLYFFALITEEGFLIFPCSSLEFHIQMGVFPFLLYLSLLFFSQLFVRPPQTAILPFGISFLGMVLMTASCIMSQTSIHSSSGTVSDLIPWIYFCFHCIILSIWFRSYLNGLVFFPTFLNLSLNFAMSSWSEPQSVPGLIFSNCIELLYLQLQRV